MYNKNRTEIIFITKKALANQNVFEINDGVEYFNTDISLYSGIKKLVIPEGIEKIEASAFTNCPSFLKIEIPKTVKSIGGSCFSDNTSSLEEILIKNKEDSITWVPWWAAKGMKVVQWEK